MSNGISFYPAAPTGFIFDDRFLFFFLLETFKHPQRSNCQVFYGSGSFFALLELCSVERARAGFATIKTAAAEEKFFTAAVGDESIAFIAYDTGRFPAGRSEVSGNFGGE